MLIVRQKGSNQSRRTRHPADVDSVLEGLRLSLSDLQKTIRSPTVFLHVHKDLYLLFLKVLEQNGLRPMVSRV